MKSCFHLFKKSLATVVITTFISAAAYSQDMSTCAEKLQMASTYFDRGQVENVAGLLHDCLISGFNREESITAYKLIIQSYLFEDKLEKADEAMLVFLNKNPEYQLSSIDHSSFVNLYNSFNVKTALQVSVRLGTSYPVVSVLEKQNAKGFNEYGKYSAGLTNLFLAVEAKYKLTNRFDVGVELGFSQLSFKYEEDFLKIGQINYNETQTRIEAPAFAIFNVKKTGKFVPYVRLGAGPSLALSSTATAEVLRFDKNGVARERRELDRKDSRYAIDIFAQAGAGLKIKTRGGWIFGEARLNAGLLNQTQREKHPSTTNSAAELNTHYYYVDDDFTLNTVNINVGYTQIFYNPQKRKQ